MKRLLMVWMVVGAILASSVGASASHGWATYHWSRSANPFSLTLIDSVTSTWDASFTMAKADWSLSSVLDLNSVEGNTGKRNRKRCNPSSGKIRVCNASYGNNGWLGVAEIWLSGSHVMYGRVRLNDSYFSTSTYDKPEWRSLVMCQEVGHNFGLGHQDETFGNVNLGSCMDYTNDPTTNQHPNAHDYEQLEAMYAHMDSASSSSSTSSSSSAQSTQSRRGWHSRNCDVSQSGGLTKVTWTLPAS